MAVASLLTALAAVLLLGILVVVMLWPRVLSVAVMGANLDVLQYKHEHQPEGNDLGTLTELQVSLYLQSATTRITPQ